MSPAILFAGPSLAGFTPPPGIDHRGPARCGDLLRALADKPRAIGLVDGLFETSASVWHKEILAVMAAGVPVLGAASLGALRAAELHMFGMIGIGQVFAAYRDGEIERDDAVMVSHAPPELGWRPLSVALVDIAAAIEAAGLDRALLRIAARLNFRDRSWRNILAAYRASHGDAAADAAGDALGPEPTSLKRRDAEALLAALAGPIDWSQPPPPPRTTYLARLTARIGSEAEARIVQPTEQQSPIPVTV
jgi:hypothetical protein